MGHIIGYQLFSSITLSVLPCGEDAAEIERILGEYVLEDAKIRRLQALGQEGGQEWAELELVHMDPSLEKTAITEDSDSVVPLHEGGKLYNMVTGQKVEADYLIVNDERRSMDVTIYTKYGDIKLEEILGKHACYTSAAYPTYLRFGVLEELVIELLQILKKYYK